MPARVPHFSFAPLVSIVGPDSSPASWRYSPPVRFPFHRQPLAITSNRKSTSGDPTIKPRSRSRLILSSCICSPALSCELQSGMVPFRVATILTTASPLAVIERITSAVSAGDDVDKLAMSNSRPRGVFVTAFAIPFDFTSSSGTVIYGSPQIGFVLAFEDHAPGSPQGFASWIFKVMLCRGVVRFAWTRLAFKSAHATHSARFASPCATSIISLDRRKRMFSSNPRARTVVLSLVASSSRLNLYG